jgi:DMSO/TMAO reductase YedYZ molybdopterin-dependent catalytic subunit
MKYAKLLVILLITMLAAVAVSGCTSSGTNDTPQASGLKTGLADNPNYQIEIVGGVNSPVTVTYADIKAMDFTEMNNVTMINSAGTEKTSDFVGVPMKDILAKAGGLPSGNLTLTVSASDGYGMAYTREQVEKALLGLKENGTALTDNLNKDSIRMVVPDEPGSMWMKVPTKIVITSA